MPKYVLSQSAQNDVREIIGYIRKRSPAAARKVRTDLRRAMEKLAEFPNIGHVREEQAGTGLRFWCVHSYLIAYDPKRSPLGISRAIHGVRELSRITFGFDPQ